MTGREHLERIRDLQREIARRKARMETLRRYATCITSRIREISVRSSHDPSRMQMFLAEAADEEAEIRRLEQEVVRVRDDLLMILSQLPEENLIRVVELHYLSGYTWPEIAILMDCSERKVYYLHRRALKLLSDDSG